MNMVQGNVGLMEILLVVCMYNYKEGIIQYSINGQDLGVACTVQLIKMKGDEKEESLEKKLLFLFSVFIKI